LGQADLKGQTLTWQSNTPQGERSLQVIVSSRDGRTRIRIEERLNNLAAGLFGGMVGGGGGGIGLGVGLGVGIGALQSAAFATAWPVAIIGGAYLLARRVYGSTAKRRQRALRDLLDRLTELVQAVTADQSQPPETRRHLPGTPSADA
jgi:predicted lipid-binding transport protein (Tim44 family)